MGKSFATMPDGTRIIVRHGYRSSDFTVPDGELERLAHIRSGWTAAEVLAEHDGELSSYRRIRDFERDGRQWTLLVHPTEYAIELSSPTAAPGRSDRYRRRRRGSWPSSSTQSETRYLIAREDTVERMDVVDPAHGDR